MADFLSRVIDYDDWYINPEVSTLLDVIWGPHTVDRFADCHDRQLPRFNSRCWNPGAEAVHSPQIGMVRITGGAHQSVWSLGLLGMQKSAWPRGL